MPDRIDKDRFEPAYAQLAAIIHRQIADGVYPPGEKIPSESSISKQYGLSPMTVRQAIGVLTEQGLLERIQGSGTFVKPLELTGARFDLDRLRDIFRNSEHTRVKILQLSLTKADAETAEKLRIPLNARAILIRRLLLTDNRPTLFHLGIIRCDPDRPFVEAELDLGPLSDLFSGHGRRTVKKGELALVPAVLGGEEAVHLERPSGVPVFRINYLFFDFDDAPVGYGWFTAPPEALDLKTRLGLWDEF
jgi:GntR family transcriptional regulator